MVTRNVVLSDAQSDLLETLVASGRYQNANGAMRAGLRLLEREERMAAALRERLMAGREQARRGELAPGSGAEAVRRAFSRAGQAGN